MHDFLTEFLRVVPYPKERLVIVADNHGCHKANLVINLLRDNNVELVYMPIYSSIFNPIERCWWIFKQKWIKQLSKIKVTYNLNNLDRDIQLVAN